MEGRNVGTIREGEGEGNPKQVMNNHSAKDLTIELAERLQLISSIVS